MKRTRTNEQGPRAAVIGGGIAGLTCARTLVDAGFTVTVLDKGRGPGGRAATRRESTRQIDHLSFDHGAQYLTVRDERFAAQLHTWLTAGVAAPWRGRIVILEHGRIDETAAAIERYVGVPGMSALARHLGSGLEVVHGVCADRLEHRHGEWRIHTAGAGDDGARLGVFDAVIVAVPAPQAVPLLRAAPHLEQRVKAVEMSPCIAALAAFDEPLDLPFDGAFVADSPVAWASRNNSKRGRGMRERWVLHASVEWSVRYLEHPPEVLAVRLFDAFAAATGRPLPSPTLLAGHRWRYARTETPLGVDCLVDPDLRLAVCGDWCPGDRLEGAYLSGLAAAEQLAACQPAVAECPGACG